MPRKAGDAETSMFTRGRIIGMYEGGVPKMMISKKLNIDPKTIRKWILRFETHGESGLKSIPKPGAHRKTTPFEDVAIAQAVAVTPTITPHEINKMLGLSISAHTIRRRVRDAKVRSRQEKKENRIAKKKVKHDDGQAQNSEDPSMKRKNGLSGKKKKKKQLLLLPVMEQQPSLQQQTQQQQTLQLPPQQQTLQLPTQQHQPMHQPQHIAMAVNRDGPHIKVELKHELPPGSVLENGVQHFLCKPEAVPVVDQQHVQIGQHQYQTKQMPFYGFGTTTTGYEFPRIWTPMTNVNVGTAYCEPTKLTTYTGFGTTEVPQVTHSSVQTTGFLNATVSSSN